MKFSDINLNLMLKFKKSFFHSDIGKAKKSNNSFNTYVNTIKAIYNDAYENGVVFDALIHLIDTTVRLLKQVTLAVDPISYIFLLPVRPIADI